MGFSVSGATVIILIGLLIGLGTAYTAVSGSVDYVIGAQDDRADRLLAAQQTAIAIENATYENGTLTVSTVNAGETALDVTRIDVLVDGVYQNRSTVDAQVDGEQTALLLSGETLTSTLESVEEPTRVKVVVEYGVSDSIEVT